MDSIKDKVAIVGMGCTKFGDLRNKSIEDIIVEAAYEAYEDAGIEPKDVQMAYVGSVTSGEMGLMLSRPLKLQYIPVTHVENLCATGSEAIRAAAYAIAAGVCDIALALGFEKNKDKGLQGSQETVITPMSVKEYMFPPGNFSLLANRYFHHYGLTYEEGKELMAMVAVKNHHNGCLHPKAHLRSEITLEKAMNAPIIAHPFGVFDACASSEGAAAAILTRADIAKTFRPDPLYLKALTVVAGPREGRIRQDYDYTHFEENIRAAKLAYKEAGITDPVKDISMAEVHDCFTMTEAATCEDLDWCPKGKVRDYLKNGFFNLDGEFPVNTDGGLKCFGHPLGASGLRMMYEVYHQLRGKAGPRQVKNPIRGLTHNLGGGPGTSVCSVFIAGNEKG